MKKLGAWWGRVMYKWEAISGIVRAREFIVFTRDDRRCRTMYDCSYGSIAETSNLLADQYNSALAQHAALEEAKRIVNGEG